MQVVRVVPLALILVARTATAEPVATAPEPTEAQEASEQKPPEGPAAALSMVSAVPRWPFIAAAAGVFLVMALLGLRRGRRRS